ncbi:S4 domain-containing protein [Luteimonas sp. MC1825]|uniref:RNA-binding S4 domain-containing protein n=1 Tax=Luteimonas sp. MC1825 TaxID=2761107 RepID=UPI00160A2545|nr:S4 domain-containing protein [Luteimonas sp. MC1825]MBB6598901.1 RNA-binding protein [Luteimonas sp. MC1825]QOC89047.1 RNA-binding protein [Luteimonas sp. MC1825]
MPATTAPTASAGVPASIRIDVWLWAARFFRTRTLARQAVEHGKVELGGQRPKASRAVRVGDRLRIARGEEVFVVEVAALTDSRGPAPVAQALYREDEASLKARDEARLARRDAQAGYRAPEHRPDKRARRLIRALGDIDLS